jgi:endonuclease-3
MELAQAKPADVEKIIFSTGFYRNKAKSLIACARSIQETYQGELPRDMAGMLRLAGVGRKTANVVLGNAFGIQAGVVVDTHVMRLSQLVGLTTERTPEKIEIDLMQLLPQEVWTNFSHWLILHGRKTCIARRPNCHQCGIRKLCAFGMHEPTDQEPAPKTRKAPQRKVK